MNPSGGLIACGHPVGATGLMQGVFALWQLQGTIGKHFGDDRLQIQNPRRGAIHSHAGTGTCDRQHFGERGVMGDDEGRKTKDQGLLRYVIRQSSFVPM